MKKLFLVVLALMANHVNCQTSPPLMKTNQAIVAKIKQQLKNIEAEQEKLVLSIKGAPELINKAKDWQKKQQAPKTPEQIKLEDEFRELSITDCIAERTNPEIIQINARFDELDKIIADLTKEEEAQLGSLENERLNLEKVLSKDETIWLEASEEHQKTQADLSDQMEQLRKQFNEKTLKQASEINRLHAQREKLLNFDKRLALRNKIDEISDPLSNRFSSENVRERANLRNEFVELIRESVVKERILTLKKKYNDLLDKLPEEEQCAYIFRKSDAEAYGGLMLFEVF